MTKQKNKRTLGLMWELIKYRPYLYFANFLIFFLVFLLPVIPGFLYDAYYTKLEANTITAENIVSFVLCMGAVYLSRALLLYIGAYVDTIHRFYICNLVRYNVMREIFSKPASGAFKGTVGTLTDSINEDANQIEESITWTIDIISTYTFAVLSAIILLRINWKITIAAFLPFVIVLLMVKKLKIYIENNRKKVRELSSGTATKIMDYFQSIQAVKAAGSEEAVTRNLMLMNERKSAYVIKDKVFSVFISALNKNLVSISTGIILLMAAFLMENSALGIGDLIIFLYYLDYISEFTMEFGEYLAHFKQTEIAFQRLSAYVEPKSNCILTKHQKLDFHKQKYPVIVKNEEKVHLENIEYRNICFGYQQDEFLIKDFSLKVKRGERIAITGKIGSGKTSLLKNMAGLLPMDSGEVYCNGEKVENVTEFFSPPFCTYLSQTPRFFMDTVRENILLGMDVPEQSLSDVIGRSALNQDMEQLDKGLETFVGANGKKISGGQRKRIALARALIRKTELVMIDDLSSGLDRETEKEIWRNLFADKEKTYIIATNNEQIIKLCDQVILL